MAAGLEQTILALHPFKFWMWAGLLFAAASGCFYGAFHFFRRKRLMEDTPTSKIRSAAQGYVELAATGHELPGGALTAPLTGLPCLWFSYRIEERRHRLRRSGSAERWHLVERGTSSAPFLLRDDTGECIVDPRGADCTPDHSKVWFGASRHPRRPDRARSPASLLLRGRRRYRYTETLISSGHPLYVMGHFRSRCADSADFDQGAAVRDLLRDWKRDRDGLRERFDFNGDGDIDPAEWRAVRSFAANQIAQERRQAQQQPAVHWLAQPPGGARPFLISTAPESRIARRCGYYALAAMAGFLLSGGALTYLLNGRF